MKYIIMCGGKKQGLTFPPALKEVNDEVIVERTIRLLRELGIKDISISCNLDNNNFDHLDIPIIKMVNNYNVVREENGSTSWDRSTGYGVEAFYDTNEPTCYLCGDVWYSRAALKTIVDTPCKDFLMFGTHDPMPEYYGKDHDEPAGGKISDGPMVRKYIAIYKERQDRKDFCRYPMSGELYRLIDGIDPYKHQLSNRFIGIHDFIGDIDSDGNLKNLENIIKKYKLD